MMLRRWAPNWPTLRHAPAMCGTAWDALPRPATGSDAKTTFDSQPTFVFAYVYASGNTVLLYMGDRWNIRGPGSVHPYVLSVTRCPYRRAVRILQAFRCWI